ncbi:MAG: bifunctional 2',3'-cyclic-nucleotide 2'-phosphodiesterase/3'-nucleotidase [Paracoccaceae bacterium]|nr:bifunctional 2',3'-cyclic-nucleotide 2'-phosphodiesterase/3'-nucleotidase [Paracoccaceae bacterium]
MTDTPAPRGRNAATAVHLRLIATTDLHSHIYPYDYFADRPTDTAGLSRTASLIAAAKAEVENSLTIDNGDILQGNPLGDYIAYERGIRPGEGHPMLRAMQAAGVEATTLGNHEFNYGLEFLHQALDGAGIAVVSANVLTAKGATPAEDRTLVPPYAILPRDVTDADGRRHRLNVGLIGFVPPQILQWDHHALDGRIFTRDIVETAAARVPELRARGADVVIALAHTGIGAAEPLPGMENAATALATVPGIDVIVAGHTHRVFPSSAFDGHPGADAGSGTLHGVPAVMAGFWGSHIGVVDLTLRPSPDGWRIEAARSEVRPIWQPDAEGAPVATVRDAPAVLAAAKAEHAETLTYIRRPVGHLTAPLTSYFALVADDPSVQIVAEAQRAYLAEMLEGTAHAHLPILSAAGPFKSGGRGGPDYYTDIPAGPLALKNVADLYLYPNTVRGLKISGADLREWLERSVGLYNRLTPGGQDQPLIDTRFATYNFDVIAGVTYEIDLSQPSRYDPDGRLVTPDARRIVNLRHKGAAVAETDAFVIATNNYRASGGGDFPGAKGDTIIFVGPDTNRDVLLRHIHARQTITPPAADTWRFAPLPGTTALFDTGPGARTAPRPPGLRLDEVGPAPGGFLRYRLSL